VTMASKRNYRGEYSVEVIEEVVLGVDTHLDAHVAVALDGLVGTWESWPCRPPRRAMRTSSPRRTASARCGALAWRAPAAYGAGLARHLRSAGIGVLEVERPKRRHLRRKGKSDSKDAERAARAVLAGETAGEAKSADGRVEMIRVLRAARRSAVKARTQAANQLRGVRVTAPDALQQRLRGLSTKELVGVATRFRLGGDPDDVEEATKFALRSVARRYRALSEEIADLDARLHRLVAEAAPELISLPAVGTDHAATLLVVAGDNPERLGSEASFASLCGVFPVEASSGRVVRHRLNRGGNRDANRALHLICVVRMRVDERTRRYAARRASEGKSKWEIIRCLKRYVAREVYRILVPSGASADLTVDERRVVAVTGVT
jgi:transposase